MEAARRIVHDEYGWAGVWRDVFVEAWTKAGTPAAIRDRFEARRAFGAELAPGRKMVTVTIVHSAAAKPVDAETRAALQAGIDATDARMKGTAVVLLADGFKAVVIRSVIAALMLAVATKYPTKTFDGVDEALVWLTSLLDDDGGRAPTIDELRAAVRALQPDAAARVGA